MALRVWLPLTGTLENKGISNITVTNTDANEIATVNTEGKIGSCYSFNGSGTRIHLSGTDLFNCIKGGTQPFSLALWVYHGDSRRAILFGDYGTTGAINVNIELTTGHIVRFYWNGNPDYNTGVNIGASVWSHLTMTYNGNKLCTYLNGVLAATNNITLPEKNKTSGEFFLGRDYRTSATALKGRLNDFRVYDHCLSAAEVHEISQGLVLHYKLDQQYLKSGTNLVTDVTKGGQTTKLTDGRLGVITSGTNADTYFTINLSESITNGTTYHFSCDASGITEGRYWNFPLGAQGNSSLPCKIYNGHNEYVFTANDISWGSNRLFMDDIERSDWANPATFYNFVLTKNATYEVKDSSGYGHNGTIEGNILIVPTEGRYTASIKLNSENPTTNTTGAAYIVASLALNSPSQMTIAWWAKPENGYGSSAGHAAFATTNNSMPSDYNTTAFNHRDSGFDINYSTTGSNAIRLSLAYTLNELHHYAVTYDGQTAIAYKDGIQTATKSFSAKQNLMSFVRLFIGYSQAGGVKRKTVGTYSDFRVYCTALSADDILTLYHTSAKIDNQQNFHTYELVENQSAIKITKHGQTKLNELNEATTTKFYKTNKNIDTKQIIEF